MDRDVVVGMSCLEVWKVHERMKDLDSEKDELSSRSRKLETKVVLPPPGKKAGHDGSCLQS